jgi:RNA polymerase sigma-70 factor (ECF subfamily)
MAVTRTDQTEADAPRPESIEALFLALESPLLRYALRYLREPDMAQDIVQEAFLRLHARFDEVREPRSWLYRTVHNLALNHQQRADRTVPLEPNPSADHPADDPADPQPLPDEAIARWEGVGLVRLGLETLDPRSRELLRLKFNDGMSYKDISARTGLTVGHVGYLLHHAVKALAAELARCGMIP